MLSLITQQYKTLLKKSIISTCFYPFIKITSCVLKIFLNIYDSVLELEKNKKDKIKKLCYSMTFFLRSKSNQSANMLIGAMNDYDADTTFIDDKLLTPDFEKIKNKLKDYHNTSINKKELENDILTFYWRIISIM